MTHGGAPVWTGDQEGRTARPPCSRPARRGTATERSASEPWYRLYYDTRARTLSVPALSPGDVLEVAWRVEVDLSLVDFDNDGLLDIALSQAVRSTLEGPTNVATISMNVSSTRAA